MTRRAPTPETCRFGFGSGAHFGFRPTKTLSHNRLVELRSSLATSAKSLCTVTRALRTSRPSEYVSQGLALF